MVQEYLIGELSVLLERLQSASPPPARDLARLRHQVETGPAGRLAGEAAQALALADQLCWDSLSRGDAGMFGRQAAICADLHLFGTCARLLTEE